MDWPQLLHLALHLNQDLGHAIAQYGTAVYALLFLVVFCEIGFLPLFFLPGDPLIFLCGAFCAAGGLSLSIVMPLLFLATVAGSALNYRIGRAIGRQVFTRDYRWLDKAALQRTHTFYETHGGITFLLSPFIAVVRTFAPFVAGVAAMSFGRFLLYATTGAGVWVAVLVPAGYFFGNVPVIRDHMSAIVLLGIGLGVGGLMVNGVWRMVRRKV